jgi:hypothetical protein
MNINFFTLVSENDPQIYFGGDNVVFWGPMSWTVIFGLDLCHLPDFGNCTGDVLHPQTHELPHCRHAAERNQKASSYTTLHANSLPLAVRRVFYVFEHTSLFLCNFEKNQNYLL